MNRLEKKLKEIKLAKRKALSVFLTAGYPSASATPKLVEELEKCGVDFFEIGFPFSDPIADGPVIQESSEASLKRGITWNKLVQICKTIRKKSEVPLVLMTYANPLFARGWERAASDIRGAGFDGIIIPDLIPEETRQVRAIFRGKGLSLIYLCAPTSPAGRIRRISRESSGFVYCVSVTGVTGARKTLPTAEIKSFLKNVKKNSPLPIFLGFGISDPDQLREFKDVSDGFIIGSALIRALGSKNGSNSLIKRAKSFIIPFTRKNEALSHGKN